MDKDILILIINLAYNLVIVYAIAISAMFLIACILIFSNRRFNSTLSKKTESNELSVTLAADESKAKDDNKNKKEQ